MKNIIIIGHGGFAKEVFGYLDQDIKDGKVKEEIRIKGFLADREEDFLKSGIPSQCLGCLETYTVKENDYFIVAIGHMQYRLEKIGMAERKNAKIFTFIHSSTIILENNTVGEGSIICPQCVITSNAMIGKHCILNVYSSIGHDSILGDYSIMSPYSLICGNVKTGNHLFMGSKAAILPDISIGNDCVIGAGVMLNKDMEDNKSVFPKMKKFYLNKTTNL